MTAAKGELALIEWIRRRVRVGEASVPAGIGDDMAWLRSDDPDLLVTTDLLLDGVHFDAQRQDLRRIGRKAIGCSLSDVAAMAGRPIAAVASVALPAQFSFEQATRLCDGMLELADAFECPLVGGDTTSWPGRLAVNVAMLAVPDGVGPVRRNGAKEGDEILVTGRLGGSLLGGHLDFEPRVREARALAVQIEIHAMIDLSDGLSTDLHHICRESGVGAVLFRDALARVAGPDAHRAAESDGVAAIDHVLNDGEDFELLLAAAPGSAAFLATSGKLPDCGLTRIGQVGGSGVALRSPDGELTQVEPGGFEHFT